MERMKIFHLTLALLAILSLISVNGQITTPCTSSMISTFTPCLNYVTGSSASGSSTPTQSCCDSFKSLMSNSVGCACLVVTANVPIQLPLNPTLLLNLPQACNMGGVAVQCKASGTPLPAPGPITEEPELSPLAASPLSPRGISPLAASPISPRGISPLAASPLSPRASKQSAFAPALSDDTNSLAPPPLESEAPTTSSRIRPVLTPPSPSTSPPSYISSPAIVLLFLGILIFNGY